MPDTAPLPLPRPLPPTRPAARPAAPRGRGPAGPARPAARSAARTAAPRGRGPRRPAARTALAGAVVLLVVAAVVAVAAWAGSSWGGGALGGAGTTGPAGDPAAGGVAVDPTATGVAGGVVPDGTGPFDVDVPAVAGLEPRLLGALQAAATAAEADGVPVLVTSGWRSAAHQQQLLDDAVAQYGTPEEAARWVSTPTTSEHVHGGAVDIGSWDAIAWFSENGAAYDLCQIYMNETWHWELRDGASVDGCPPMYRDPTEDPRTRR